MSAPAPALSPADTKLLQDCLAHRNFQDIGKDLGLSADQAYARYMKLLNEQPANVVLDAVRPAAPAAAAAAPSPVFAVGDRVRFKSTNPPGCFTITGGAPGTRAAVSIKSDDDALSASFVTSFSALEKVPFVVAGTKRKEGPAAEEGDRPSSPKKAKPEQAEEEGEKAIAALLARVPKSKQLVQVVHIEESMADYTQAFIPVSFLEEQLGKSCKEFCALPIEELFAILLDHCCKCAQDPSCSQHQTAYGKFMQHEANAGAKWVMKDQVVVALITLPYEL